MAKGHLESLEELPIAPAAIKLGDAGVRQRLPVANEDRQPHRQEPRKRWPAIRTRRRDVADRTQGLNRQRPATDDVVMTDAAASSRISARAIVQCCRWHCDRSRGHQFV